MLRTIAALTLAGGALGVAAAPAGAQAPALPEVYGGGAVFAGPVTETGDLKAATQSTAIGLRRIAVQNGGWTIRLRVALVASCGSKPNGNARGTDVKVAAPMNADGTAFSIAGKRLRVPELGRVRVWASGTFTPARADGTARVVSDGFKCGGQTRPWSARPADPKTPPPAAPAAPVDGTLYGVTAQDITSYPRGIVAQVGAGGTTVHAFTSYDETCRWTIKGTKSTEPDHLQLMLNDRAIAGGRADRTDTVTETKAQRRQGIDAWQQKVLRSAFAGPVWAGTFRNALRYRQGSTASRCTSPTIAFVASP